MVTTQEYTVEIIKGKTGRVEKAKSERHFWRHLIGSGSIKH